MKEVSKLEIVNFARGYQEAGQNWHYHLLTPTCQFNVAGRFALLLEGIDAQEVTVHYSDEAEMETSKSLASLLHGEDVVVPDNFAESSQLSIEEQGIISLLKELQEEKITWHHHVFFPGCIFNSHSGKFELVLEDPRNGQHLTAIGDNEPKEALKVVEVNFYNQA